MPSTPKHMGSCRKASAPPSYFLQAHKNLVAHEIGAGPQEVMPNEEAHGQLKHLHLHVLQERVVYNQQLRQLRYVFHLRPPENSPHLHYELRARLQTFNRYKRALRNMRTHFRHGTLFLQKNSFKPP